MDLGEKTNERKQKEENLDIPINLKKKCLIPKFFL